MTPHSADSVCIFFEPEALGHRRLIRLNYRIQTPSLTRTKMTPSISAVRIEVASPPAEVWACSKDSPILRAMGGLAKQIDIAGDQVKAVDAVFDGPANRFFQMKCFG